MDRLAAPPGEDDLVKEWRRYLPRGFTTHFPIAAARARGSTIETESGAEFLDFTTGIGVNAAGHLHPDVASAVRDQADRYLHLCFSCALYRPMVDLARRLTEIAPDVVEKVAFFNSGAEAVENAVKICRSATGRPNVIVFDHAFHGRTLLAMTMTGKMRPYNVGFGPFAPAVYRAPFPDRYRRPRGMDAEDHVDHCIDGLERVMRTDTVPEETAAIVAEPVQGEGGFNLPEEGFFPRVREVCDDHGIPLVSDEVQAGLGRTGRWLSMDHFGATPDLVCLGKAIGGGLPLSATAGRADLIDAPEDGAIGGTFAGNPLSLAAGLAALDVIEDHLDHVRALGDRGLARLEEVRHHHPFVGDARGLGLMLAVEFVTDRATKQPAREAAEAVQAACYDRGLLVLTAGAFDNVIRLLPPLTITEEEFDRGLDVVVEAIAEVEAGLA